MHKRGLPIYAVSRVPAVENHKTGGRVWFRGPFAAPFSRYRYLHYCACVTTPHTNIWCRYSNLSTGAGTVDTALNLLLQTVQYCVWLIVNHHLAAIYSRRDRSESSNTNTEVNDN